MLPPILKELGHERVTVDATSGGKPLTAIPAGARWALMRVKGTAGDGLCFRSDGTDPTNATGMELEVGEVLWFDAHLSKFKAIRRNSSSVTLVVAYYGQG